jgi:hypothetical protein
MNWARVYSPNKNPISMRFKQQTLIVAAGTVLMTLSACHRDDNDAQLDNAKDESVANIAERQMEASVDAAFLRQGSGGNGGGTNPCGEGSPALPDCAEITDSGESDYPRTLVIDFGDGCTNENGVTRTGQITVVLTGDVYTEVGATRTFTTDNFQVNDVEITAEKVLTNTGEDAEGHPTFSRTADMIVSRNGHTFFRTAEGTMTWLAGYDTADCFDNIVQRDGTANHTRENGNASITRVVDAVVYDQPCGYPVSGIVTIDRPFADVIIDFGDGTCDNLASVTRNGNTFTIDLDTHEIIE